MGGIVGGVSKILGGGSKKPAPPPPAPTPDPKPDPVRSTKAERVAAARLRRRGTGYRGLLGATRFSRDDDQVKTTLGAG